MDVSCSVAQRNDCEPLQDVAVVCKDARERACSEYIRSWAGVTRGVDAMEINYRTVTPETALKFEIVSARTVVTENQKYVAYTVMVTMAGAEEDPYPAVVERRYTDFLNLFNSLKRDFPDLLLTFQFPKKALVGNFSPETISGRSNSFEQFLEVVGSTAQVRTCRQVTEFLQRQELTFALKLINNEEYEQASTLVENCFRIMNKLQTDRSIVVLQNLCLLICVYEKLHDSKAMDLACLAVRRFQGVSDSDLLRYYVPLLNISLQLSRKYGNDSASLGLEERLSDLRTRGIALHDSTHLLKLLMDDLSPTYPKD
uniref:Sorting nexin-20 n=1 Tax=Lygus hesperus TaxID=30085 RepID=A0A146KPX4_LYGHE